MFLFTSFYDALHVLIESYKKHGSYFNISISTEDAMICKNSISESATIITFEIFALSAFHYIFSFLFQTAAQQASCLARHSTEDL